MTELKRILHVDDDPDTLNVVKTILEKEGYEVISVERGKAALEKIKDNNFDLLIFDIMMPDMSGWDLYSKISELKKEYKVIFLTVLEITQAKLKELKSYGIIDYINKPFDKNDLVARVKQAISNK